jgi:hypothetical protein
MFILPTADESFEHLRRAGWLVGEKGRLASWIVFGTHGRHGVAAMTPNRAES